MNIYSSHARPKTKTSDKLVGVADYMGTSLEANDNHTMHMYIKIQQMHIYHDKLSSIQQDQSITYKDKTNRCDS